MALTEYQRDVCRIVAASRAAAGESYVAGGVALNEAIHATRISRDVDVFHDTVQAVASTSLSDRKLLVAAGFGVAPLREREGFVEAIVSRGPDSVIMQWAADSAYRFFPLVPHADFGLALHPFDLATNKVLALVGRLEVRDWVDLIGCHERLQRLGYLAWAACGKDPGFSPRTILEHAARSSRYSPEEVAGLSFAGVRPDPAALSRSWHAMLAEAHDLVAALPPAEAGKCVLDRQGRLFTGGPADLPKALSAGHILFHEGAIYGALPRLSP